MESTKRITAVDNIKETKMDLTENIQKLKEEIYFGGEALGSLGQALHIAKTKHLNRNYMIPDHMWPSIEAEIEEEASEWAYN